MTLSRRAFVTAGLSLPVLSLLAGCGTSEPAAAPPASHSAGPSGPITVTDARGKEVTLDAPATRVVVLEWGPTEDVLTLGVQPVGVADPTGFGSWVSSQQLAGDPVDVGLRTEPSLESIARAEPDLVLGIVESVPQTALAQVERIAPLVLLKGADATRPVEQMRENFETTAKLLGKDAEASRIWSDFEAAIEGGRQRLASVSTPYVFSYIGLQGATADFRMHSDRSLPGAIAKQLGLTNGWAEPGDDAWGIGSVDLEGLTRLPADTTFLHWANSAADPLPQLAGNPVWAGLPFVQAERVKAAANGVWVYGGPASLTQWIDELVTGLAA